ncbi:hypothetical protein H5410_061572, partial [Solanum commersonii]
KTLRRFAKWTQRSSGLHFFVLFSLFVPFCDVVSMYPQLKLLLVLKQTQVQPFKKGVLNSASQDSIMNEHNKTQFTYSNIKCLLKDSNCDSPISTNLMLTIVASNATIVFKCPHTKNDFILTQWLHTLKIWNQMQHSHSQGRT